MTPPPLLSASWATGAGQLDVREPDAKELAAASRELATFYNDPYSARMMNNTIHFTPADVVDVWGEIAREPGRALLLLRDGEIVGDAAFRHLREDDGSAELGLLIGPSSSRGVGLGGRFTEMLLGLAFGPLGRGRVFVAIRPDNAPSLRLFSSRGFVRDDGPRARACAESDDEVCMVLEAQAFALAHRETLREIDISRI